MTHDSDNYVFQARGVQIFECCTNIACRKSSTCVSPGACQVYYHYIILIIKYNDYIVIRYRISRVAKPNGAKTNFCMILQWICCSCIFIKKV